MANANTLTNAMVFLLIAVSPSFAAESTQSDHGGIVVLLFLGLFAVIVVARMVPAIVVLLGVVKGVAGATAKASGKDEDAAAENPGK